MSQLEAKGFDGRLRSAAMAWLDRRCTPDNPVVERRELLGFEFEGRRVPLVDNQLGIRKPQGLTAALSILTTYTSDGRRAPYEDALGPDGFLRYKYQGNPQHYTNKGLREAHTLEVPLIWFFGVQQGLYLPFYPVWIVADEPAESQVAVALDESQANLAGHASLSPLERRYSERISRQRLHQPVFRQRVIRAYDTSCAMCRLRHASLLDAAHIIPDREERGLPAVSNGLSLCKIHHAAYDANILGIRPTLTIEVRTDILQEVDGPMLRHGLQEMNGVTLTLPRRQIDRPDVEAIEQRYETFRKAG
ncbi:HNH endonuclease [Actinomadura sp. NTSP31]|uniref:HNH endonuclease n=1 Tax=Actinomadura sp. NTSP31 TaxID=1735447 RepID=UPI0035C1F0DF